MVEQGLSKISAKTSEPVESQRHWESQLRDLRALNALVEATTDNPQKKLSVSITLFTIFIPKTPVVHTNFRKAKRCTKAHFLKAYAKQA